MLPIRAVIWIDARARGGCIPPPQACALQRAYFGIKQEDWDPVSTF
jgi:hypothetical protein